MATLFADRWEVELPAGHEPAFPERCAATGEAADTVWKVSDRSLSPWAFISSLFYWTGRKQRFEVPMSRQARSDLVRTRWIRRIGAAITIAAVIAWLAPNLESWGLSGGGRRLVILGALFLAVVPPATVKLLWPDPIEIDVHKKKTEFTFTNYDYAQEFATLNGATAKRW